MSFLIHAAAVLIMFSVVKPFYFQYQFIPHIIVQFFRKTLWVCIVCKLFSKLYLFVRSFRRHSEAYNSSNARKCQKDRDVLKMKESVTKIINELENGSTFNRLEQAFRLENPLQFDVCLKNYHDFLISLEKYWGREKVNYFSSKLLDVTKECKSNRVFQTQFMVFWIKVQSLLEDGCLIEPKEESDVDQSNQPISWLRSFGRFVSRFVCISRDESMKSNNDCGCCCSSNFKNRLSGLEMHNPQKDFCRQLGA